MSFQGLPSPGAAGVIVSLVIFQQDDFPAFDVLVYLLPFVTLGAALLMVSPIRYPHVLNVYLTGKKPFHHLIWILFLLGIAVWNLQIALVVAFGVFAGGTFLKWLYGVVANRRPQAVLTTDLAAGAVPGLSHMSDEPGPSLRVLRVHVAHAVHDIYGRGGRHGRIGLVGPIVLRRALGESPSPLGRSSVCPVPQTD